MATIDFFSIEGKLEVPDGMTSPYANRLVVDAAGRGDYTTITAAIAAAVAAGGEWEIEFGPGDWDEDPEVPNGISLRGAGGWQSRILGQPVYHAGCSLSNFCVIPPAGSTWCAHYISDSANRAVMTNVHHHTDDIVNGLIVGLRVSGTTGGPLQAYGCRLQVENKSTGASAELRLFHILSGANNAEVLWSGGYLKTVTANSGTARAKHQAVKNEGTGSSHIRLFTHWYINKGTGYQVLESSNPNHPGATGTIEVDDDGITAINVIPDVTHATLTAAGFSAILAHRVVHSFVTIQREMFFAGKRLRFGTAAPTTGTAGVGDIVYNSAPALGGDRGWICTVAGTPGTWRDFGEIPGALAPSKVFGPSLDASQKNTGALAVNVVRAVRFTVEQTTSFVTIGVDVTVGGGAGALARLMIFSDTGTTQVGTLLVDAGTDDASTNRHASKTIAWTAKPGTYWLAVGAQVAGFTMRICNGSDAKVPQTPGSGVVNNGFAGTHNSSITVGGAFAYTGETGSAPYIVLTTAP